MTKIFSANLQSRVNRNRHYKSAIAVSILAVLCIIIYSNSFEASWHFDDYENILENARVQIRDVQPVTISQTFFASPDGKRTPYRSVSYFSFALNAYFGGKNVFGFHLVNIAVHLLTALMLKLFNTPKL